MKKVTLRIVLAICLLTLLFSCSEKKVEGADTTLMDSVEFVNPTTEDTLTLDTINQSAELTGLKICSPIGVDRNLLIEPSDDLDDDGFFKKMEKRSREAWIFRPRGGIIEGCKWRFPTGSKKTLKVYFINGPNLVIKKIHQVVKDWELASGIKFEFIDEAGTADIRVAFKKDKGTWSYIGKDSRKFAPSMNFSWLDNTSTDDEIKRVVLHEFGHAVGFGHEHQNPNRNPIKWNIPNLTKWFVTDMGWNHEQLQREIIDCFKRDQWIGGSYDSTSIMIYAIDPRLTDDHYSIDWNKKLSPEDIRVAGENYKTVLSR